MIWWKSKKSKPSVTTADLPVIPDDIAEARQLRQEARAELGELRAQAPLVQNLAKALVDRKALNHFGDDITITFVRR